MPGQIIFACRFARLRGFSQFGSLHLAHFSGACGKRPTHEPAQRGHVKKNRGILTQALVRIGVDLRGFVAHASVTLMCEEMAFNSSMQSVKTSAAQSIGSRSTSRAA